MNKKTILLMVALFSGAMVLIGVTQAFAQTTTTDYPSIVTKLAQKFGLKETDVKAVFDEHHAEHHKVMQDKIAERLTQAVTDGKLTEVQKQALLSKLTEVKSEFAQNKERFQSMNQEERKSKMLAEKQELETWAKEQGIDLSVLVDYLRPFGMGMMKHHGWHMHVN